MASIFSGQLDVRFLINEFFTGSVRNGSVKHELELSKPWSGTTRKGYSDTQSGIGASVSTPYDLSGALTDRSPDAATLNFDKVYAIAVRNNGAFPIEVGPAASNGFGILSGTEGFWSSSSARSIVPPGGHLVLQSEAGVPAVNGASDQLNVITQSGSSANGWDILIIGNDDA